MQTSGTDFNAFDAMAAGYDNSFTLTPVGKMQRDQVWHHLKNVLNKQAALEILELNCGTGLDATHLAAQGHKVIATDNSEQMIQVANSRISGIEHSQQPVFMQCSFRDVAGSFPDKKFDLIFSDFGGLNCISRADLKILSRDIYSLLKPGGRCVLVVMGTHCCWERIYFLLKGRRKEAFRRQKNKSVMAATGNGFTETWYHSPGMMKRIFGMDFTYLFKRPIGLFVPQSYLNPFFQKHNRLLGMLGFLDKLFGGIAMFSNFADHFIIAFQKKETAAKASADCKQV